MTNVEKIFVDPDEEIVFTAEKIRQAKSDRVILVVPQTASLMSSIVSLKLLSKQLLKHSGKTVVIVSDSETGARLGEKAKLIVKPKISNVDRAAWEQAHELIEAEKSKKEARKQDLLSARKEPEEQAQPQAEIEVDIAAPTVKATVVDDDDKEKDEKNDEAAVFAEKPRLEAKVTEINGITVVSGGDISEDVELLMAEKHKNLSHEPEPYAGKDDASKKSGIFLGKDLTRAAGAGIDKLNTLKKNSTPQFKKLWEKIFPRLKSLVGKSNGGRALQIVLAVILVFFIVSYLFLSKVTVALTFTQDSVVLNEAISGSTELREVDLENLLVPVEQVSKSKSISFDAESTGKGEKGNLAQGIIDLRNKTAEPISLKSGQKISNIASGLKYVIQQDINIPANTSAEDIAIKAETFGDNYNVIDQDVTFKVDGYDTNDLIGFSFRDITGGTKQEIVVVSQEDMDALKKKADEELRKQLLADISSLISAEEILLTGSEKFEEVSFSSSADVNQEIAQFSVNLELKLTAYKVQNTDLEQVAQEIIKQREASTEAAQIDVTDPEIKNIVIDGASVKFDLASEANVQEDIDEETIVQDIRGKKLDEVKDYLSKLEGLESFRVKYRPSYIPYFLQRVPDDPAKITIEKAAN